MFCYQIILIPGWVGKVCLLLGDSLAEDESAGCQRMTSRTYGTFLTGINGLGGGITGANLMDIASIGIDLGLSTANASIISDAYNRVHQEITVKNTIMADGIRADGSFGIYSPLYFNIIDPTALILDRSTCRPPLQRKLWFACLLSFKFNKVTEPIFRKRLVSFLTYLYLQKS